MNNAALLPRIYMLVAISTHSDFSPSTVMDRMIGNLGKYIGSKKPAALLIILIFYYTNNKK